MYRVAKNASVALAAATAVATWWVAPAGAHVGTYDKEAPSGSYLTTAFQLPHGCDGAPTDTVTVKLAEGVTSVKAQPVAGWTLSSTRRTLDPPIDNHGTKITETVDTVTWQAQPGNALPDDQLQMFWVTMKLPEGDAGTALEFPVIQRCGEVEEAWIEPTVEGQDEPEKPAPIITLTAADGGGHGDEPAAAEGEAAAADDGDGETATAGDGDGDSSNGLAIAGIVVGGLGLVTGAVALGRSGRRT